MPKPTPPTPITIDWTEPPPAGYVRNARGDLVHAANVSPTDIDTDETVRKIHAFGQALSSQMWRYRDHTMSDICELSDRIVARYGGKKSGGKKGNISITSFDGRLRVQLAQADQIEVGPEIIAAQSIIGECLEAWQKGSNLNLQAIVEQAFKPSADGKVSVAELLRLRRVQIDDPRWRQAQDAISDSLRPTGRAEYIRLYKRGDPSLPWVNVPLHLANVTRPDTAFDSAAEALYQRVTSAVSEARQQGLKKGEITLVVNAVRRGGPLPAELMPVAELAEGAADDAN